MTVQEKLQEVKSRVSVQNYFDAVIVPSMKSYYDGQTVDFEFKPTCCCPLHNEDTPSFRVYSHSNTYYCFGCGSGGDVVHLHQEFFRVNQNAHIGFDDAVNFLYNTFIKGKNTTKIQTKSKVEKKASTNVEMMRYSRDIVDAFGAVERAKVSLEAKIYAYDELDDIDNLVRLQLLNASDASGMVENALSGLGK